jgi:hypothetical protein
MGGRRFHRQRSIDLLAFIPTRVTATHSHREPTRHHGVTETGSVRGQVLREAQRVGGNGDAFVSMRINPDLLDCFSVLPSFR